MFDFKNDSEAMAFLAKFVSSETWKWFEEVIKAKHEAIFKELNNPRTTADGRAMLTGRLLETKYFLDFPIRSFEYYRGLEAMKNAAEAATMTEGKKTAMVAKVAFPDIVTH